MGLREATEKASKQAGEPAPAPAPGPPSGTHPCPPARSGEDECQKRVRQRLDRSGGLLLGRWSSWPTRHGC